jgi:hypothetical protein
LSIDKRKFSLLNKEKILAHIATNERAAPKFGECEALGTSLLCKRSDKAEFGVAWSEGHAVILSGTELRS